MDGHDGLHPGDTGPNRVIGSGGDQAEAAIRLFLQMRFLRSALAAGKEGSHGGGMPMDDRLRAACAQMERADHRACCAVWEAGWDIRVLHPVAPLRDGIALGFDESPFLAQVADLPRGTIGRCGPIGSPVLEIPTLLGLKRRELDAPGTLPDGFRDAHVLATPLYRGGPWDGEGYGVLAIGSTDPGTLPGTKELELIAEALGSLIDDSPVRPIPPALSPPDGTDQTEQLGAGEDETERRPIPGGHAGAAGGPSPPPVRPGGQARRFARAVSRMQVPLDEE